MSQVRGRVRRGALVLAVAVAAAAPVVAFAPPAIEALSPLERGRWQISDGQGGAARSICLGDPSALLQLEHRGLACPTEVLASEPGSATVQYTCPGRGFGHSTIRVETPRLARIDTQGIADGRPFSYRAEARRAGAC